MLLAQVSVRQRCIYGQLRPPRRDGCLMVERHNRRVTTAGPQPRRSFLPPILLDEMDARLRSNRCGCRDHIHTVVGITTCPFPERCIPCHLPTRYRGEGVVDVGPVGSITRPVKFEPAVLYPHRDRAGFILAPAVPDAVAVRPVEVVLEKDSRRRRKLDIVVVSAAAVDSQVQVVVARREGDRVQGDVRIILPASCVGRRSRAADCAAVSSRWKRPVPSGEAARTTML